MDSIPLEPRGDDRQNIHILYFIEWSVATAYDGILILWNLYWQHWPEFVKSVLCTIDESARKYSIVATTTIIIGFSSY